MKRIHAVILAVLAAVIMGATAPEQCLMTKGDNMAFTTKHQDMQIKGLVTPQDGGTVFNDRPVFKAGLDSVVGITIGDADCQVSNMLGRPILSGPSHAYGARIAENEEVVGDVIIFRSSELPTNSAREITARMEIIGNISGTTDDKILKLAYSPDDGGAGGPGWTDVVSVTIPAAVEGDYVATCYFGQRISVSTWKFCLKVVVDGGHTYVKYGTLEVQDGDKYFRLNMVSQAAGDIITQEMQTNSRTAN